MPPARVGPNERFASNASVRNRFVSFIDFTVVILRHLRVCSSPNTTGRDPLCRARATSCEITYIVARQRLTVRTERFVGLFKLTDRSSLTGGLNHFGRIRGMLPEEIPEEIEVHRDRLWRRDPEFRVEDVYMAERFIDDVGFCEALTDSRRPGPSLYVAVCGRRDAHMPRNVQKDPESRLAWTIKDDVMRRGRYFYGKVLRGRATFVAPRLLPFFNAVWGVPRKLEKEYLSSDSQLILKVMRHEWEMGTRDLREAV